MAIFTERLSQSLAVVGTIDPASYNAQTNSDGVDMRLFRRVMFVISAGAIGNHTVAAVIKGGNDNSTFATTLTGKSLSASTFSGSGDNNSQAIIEVMAEECATQDVRYIRLELTPSGAAHLSAVVLAGVARYEPAVDYDLASVEQIVA
jgi:hypothetical protein